MQRRRRFAHLNWRELQEKAHLPTVQKLIREEIIRGTIRVAPAPGGVILIIPAGARPIEEFAAREVEVSLEEEDDNSILWRHPPADATPSTSG